MALRGMTLAAAMLLAGTSPAAAQSWGFESGSLEGWTPTGTAYSAQPTFGDNVAARQPGQSAGQAGNYWIGTFEYHPDGSVRAGGQQGDAPQGTLTSPLFSVSQPMIDFLVGGGSEPSLERVSLIVKRRPGDPPPGRPDMLLTLPDGDYMTVRSASGANAEQMRRTQWDVAPWRGREARIQIVDASSGPWGHINADDFHGIGALPLGTATVVPPAQPLGTATVVQPLGTATVVRPAQPPGTATATAIGGGPIIVSPPASSTGPVMAYPVGGGTVVVQPATPGGPVYADPGNPPGPGPSGRFQIVALEFGAIHQTRDDPLENDGAGDEIMVRSDVLGFAPTGAFRGREKRKSAVFGAPDRTDITAGSAVPGFSAAAPVGGFRTGDFYPREGHRPIAPGDLPFVLWEGTLSRGGDGIFFVPSIWEMDSRDTSRAELAWEQALRQREQQDPLNISMAFNTPIEDREDPFGRSLGNMGVFDDGNRPIGAATRPFRFPYPGAPLPHYAGMSANFLPLTYDRATLWASRRPPPVNAYGEGIGVQGARNLPRGGMYIEFRDPEGNDGRYYLILQVVQVG